MKKIILAALAVPVFLTGYRKQAARDCNNQKTIISSLFGEVTTGMLDSGKTQKKVDFSRVQGDHKTTYPGDGVTGNKDDAYVGKDCFVLIEDQDIPGMIAFTIGDIRGGYFGQNQWNSYSEVVNAYGQYDEYYTEKYEIGVERGYYLKKQALENQKFYIHFSNQEIPVCPFADFDNNDTSDDYRYYIFEDGTVMCSCPHCNE
jgi:hypothetical protein